MTFSLLVISPVFEEADRIRTLLDSITVQHDVDVEFVIVDSGSGDDTLRILQNHPRERLTILSFETNLGITANWTRAIMAAIKKFPSTSHVMMLAGDDAVGANFFKEIFSISTRVDATDKILVPNFKQKKATSGGSSEWIGVLPKLRKPTLFSLAYNWEWGHVCYAVVPKKFMTSSYLQSLESGNVAFDWLVASEALAYEWIFCPRANYFKHLKGISHDSLYYEEHKHSGPNEPSLESSLSQRIFQALALPFVQSIELLRLCKPKLQDLSRFQQIKWLLVVFTGRSLDHARRLVRLVSSLELPRS